MEKAAIIILAIGVAVLVAVKPRDERLKPIEQEIIDHYCDMVFLHDATQGEYGWPDYKGNASQACMERWKSAPMDTLVKQALPQLEKK